MEKEHKQELISERFFAEMKDTFFFQAQRIKRVIFRNAKQMFKEENINLKVDQFPILLTAHALEGMSQQEIADVTERDKSSAQRTLVSLEKNGLVKIVQDSTDKRKNLVYLTEEGKFIAKRIKILFKQAELQTFAVLSEEERNEALVHIKEIADKLEK
ncbi:MAG: MarR family transcriptional regulator [Bacteroidetes bacterium]|nr:MAG: MarR family transcriptional regulator [Bacteroidota bacterium]